MTVLLAMVGFSLAMSVSPGPVNMITLSIGANSGLRSALPFVTGATIGFTLLLCMIGTGLGESALNNSFLMMLINLLGSAFICYVGYTLATADGKIDIKNEQIPKFKHGFLLQWLNPKAWAACFSGVALFGTSDSSSSLYLFVAVYCVVCFFGIGAWAYFGNRALAFVNSPSRMRYFNKTMGGLLIVITLFMLSQQMRSVWAGW